MLVYAYNPATGLAVRGEQFPLEDLDAALARADELAIEFATVPTPNRAIVTGGSANRWARAGQTEWFLDHFADGFTATLANGSAITRDELVSGAVAPAVLGFGGTDRRAIAAMSDRLSLLYVGADDGTAMWSVEEVDHAGRLTRIRQFDEHSIVDAANHHDALRAVGPPRTISRRGRMPPLHSARANRARDLAQLDAALHPEFVLVDRREFGLLARSIGRRSSTCSHLEPVGDSAIIVRELLAGSDTVGVSLTTVYTLGDTGGLWESVVASSVLEHRQGQVVRLELFHDGDLDAAMARFDELGDGFDPVASFTPHIDEIQTRGDVDTFIRAAAPRRTRSSTIARSAGDRSTSTG